MHKDTSVFLHQIYNCIREFDGSIQEAYQFPHSPQTIQEWKMDFTVSTSLESET